MNLIQTVQRHLNEVKAGEGRVLEITAPYGGGRSTFIERLMEELAEGARLTLRRRVEAPRQGALLHEMILDCAEAARALDPDEGPAPWLLPGADLLEAARWRGAEARGAILSQLLLALAARRPITLIIDDAHALDAASQRTLRTIHAGLAPQHKLLILLTTAQGAEGASEQGAKPLWTRLSLDGLSEAEARAIIQARIGEAKAADIEALISDNPLLLHEALSVYEAEGVAGLAARRGVWAALRAGLMPPLPAPLSRDLQIAAIAGPRLTTHTFAALVDLRADLPAAAARLRRLVAVGALRAEGEGWRFPSTSYAQRLTAALDPAHAAALHGLAFEALRAQAGETPLFDPPRKMAIDVTDTWSEDRRRARSRVLHFNALLDAHHHALAAALLDEDGVAMRPARLLDAAEVAVALAERLLTHERHSEQTYTRIESRRWRHRARWALEVAEPLLEAYAARAAPLDAEAHRGVQIRHRLARARMRQSHNDFVGARHDLDTATALGVQLQDRPLQRLILARDAELRYASGDFHRARRALTRLLAALAEAPDAEAIPGYVWIGEQLARWEWVGLHAQRFAEICGALRQRGAEVEAMRAEVEQLSAAIALDEDRLARRQLRRITSSSHTPQLAELLALYAAELIQLRVDIYHDGLSGEFFSPDLEQHLEPGEELMDQLSGAINLFTHAETIAEEAAAPLSLLRVLSALLGVIYETRERLAALLERWRPLSPEAIPPLLTDAAETLEVGFFEIEHVESLVLRVVALSQQLGLDQVLANTLYEALDRELPSATRRLDHHLALAGGAYARVDDIYGEITLAFVEHRYRRARGEAAAPALARARRLLETRGGELDVEHGAFAQLRLGEILLEEGEREAGCAALEEAIEMYAQAGDIERMSFVGEQLSNLYREAGNFAGYRRLRERFLALERSRPGVDPLGLELRVERMLMLARAEPDDERAIERLERCAHLYQRIPGGTMRLDECFVEISKICRRRADEAANEAGFHHWLSRSLGAVERALAINKRLENHHRLFEEYHEQFDDLLGLNQTEQYQRIRAEARALAFSVGNVGELFYLFDEHLNPEMGADATLIKEARGFYEAFALFLNGLGVGDHANLLVEMLVQFLERVGEEALAAEYRALL
ncbi:hypothetical protein KKF91_01400 [Myxococcota bacterium]|nr:hypothetical protein [Myxococcota bacterium]